MGRRLLFRFGTLGLCVFGFFGFVAVCRFLDLFDAAFHVEIAFGHFVVFAVEDFLEAADGVGDLDLLAFPAGKDFRHAEGLAQETLDFAGPKYRELVVGRQFVHAQDGDDVLEVFVSL